VALRARETARDFARTPVSRKLAALHEVRARLRARGHELARLGASAKGIAEHPNGFGEELLAGAVIIQRYVRLLAESLTQIRERGAPLVTDERVQRLGSGEVSVRVMPHSLADRALFMPYTIDDRGIHVWEKKQGEGLWETYADMIWTLYLDGAFSRWAEKGYTILGEGRCVRCNRLLTTPESIKSGIGPICAEMGR